MKRQSSSPDKAARLSATPSRRDVLASFADIRCFEARGERAPNKPLLLLYALGRLQAEGRDRLTYDETHEDLARLLRQFGSPRQRVHPEQPFGRLKADGLWELQHADDPALWTASGDLKVKGAKEVGVTGGLPAGMAQRLRKDPALLREVVHQLLDGAFPPSLHPTILDSVGLDLETPGAARQRDPRFAYEVLKAYRRRCAFCGLGLRLGDGVVGLDAAHIRWHAAGGPSTISNALVLCALHHRLFDQGALTLDLEHHIRLSDELSGEGLHDISRLEGQRSALPDRMTDRPAAEHLAWHHGQVFKGKVPGMPGQLDGSRLSS